MHKSVISLVEKFIQEHPNTALSSLSELGPKDIELLYQNYNLSYVIKLLNRFSVRELALTLKDVSTEVIINILNEVDETKMLRILRFWKFDKAHMLQEEDFLSIVKKLSSSKQRKIKNSLVYPKNVIGSIVNSAPLTLRKDQIISDVYNKLKMDKDLYSRYFYVLNEESKIIGVVSFKDIAYSSFSKESIENLMKRKVFTLNEFKSIRDLINDACWSSWDLLPVVNSQSHFLGQIKYESLYRKVNLSTQEISNSHESSKALVEIIQLGVDATLGVLNLNDASKKHMDNFK